LTSQPVSETVVVVSSRRIRKLLATLFVLTMVSLSLSVSGASAQKIHCGHPPDWSGHLIAINVGCHKARAVFHHIHCIDSACTEIHSRAWSCYRHRSGAYTGLGNCHLGDKQIRWVVYE
jgi:hypothetical protein